MLALSLLACAGPGAALLTTPDDVWDTDLPPVDDAAALLGISMLQLEPGSYQMGSPDDEPGRELDETSRWVTLTRAFELGALEVTRSQFESVMGYAVNQSGADCDDCPVDAADWHETATFLNWMSAREGLPLCYPCDGEGREVNCQIEDNGDVYACAGYRLPTEAEWEYAARAGSGGSFPSAGDLPPDAIESCEAGILLSDGTPLDDVAWHCGNSGGDTHPVGSLAPNGWGLYDMAGNVYEWVEDSFDYYDPEDTVDPLLRNSRSRSSRGGSGFDYPRDQRVANRDGHSSAHEHHWLGFRVARTAEVK